MEIANILREKDALIVLYDYCLSACANYILIASGQAYVVKDTIVAWHGARGGQSVIISIAQEIFPIGMSRQYGCKTKRTRFANWRNCSVTFFKRDESMVQ
jgi:hypothetical protein